MLNESALKIGGKYLYWSQSRLCHIHVVYEGKRRVSDQFVFRDPLTLNEFWTDNLLNIVIDDGWVEKLVNEKNK